MPREFELFLRDMLEAALDIQNFTQKLTPEQFKTDRLRIAAVLHNLTIIGEAIKNIPDPLREQVFGEDWKRIAGLRDFLIHVYFGVNLDIIWNIIEVNIPELVATLTRYFESQSPSEGSPDESQ